MPSPVIASLLGRKFSQARNQRPQRACVRLVGAVLTETVFAWPGLGLYMKNSLFNADLNAVLGGTMLVGVVYIGLNMLSDLVYPLVDPRARDE